MHGSHCHDQCGACSGSPQFSQDYDISPNQLVSQTVYVHTQMVIVEGCHLIHYDDFSPPFKNFLNEGLRKHAHLVTPGFVDLTHPWAQWVYSRSPCWDNCLQAYYIRLIRHHSCLVAAPPCMLEWSKRCPWIVVAVGVTNTWVARAHAKIIMN